MLKHLDSGRLVTFGEVASILTANKNFAQTTLSTADKFAAVGLANIYADLESFEDTVDYVEKNFDERIKTRLMNILEKFYESIEMLRSNYKRKELHYALRNLKVLPTEFLAKGTEKIATDLLKIQEGDTVLGINAGDYGFAMNIENKNIKIYGADDSEETEFIGNIRKIVKDNLTVKRVDVLNEDISLQADKVFCGFKSGIVCERNFNNKKLQEFFEGMRCRICKEWLYLIAAVQYQKPGGRTIAILPENTLTNKADREIRSKLIESGKIEGIITLNDRVSLIILSDNNKFVKMFDATDIPADSIISQYNSDSENFIEVSSEKIANKNYILHPLRYLTDKKIIMNNARELREFARIIRGTQQIRQDDVDRMKSDTPTNYQYLTIQDITDSGINKNLQYLKPEYVKQYERFFADSGDIVISKFAPFKLAIVPATDKKILLGGNLYIMRIDSTKLNPYYLMLFLKSEEGTLQLNAMSSGGSARIITPSNLAEIKIPVPPIEEQNKIAEKYLALISELKDVRNKISALLENLI